MTSIIQDYREKLKNPYINAKDVIKITQRLKYDDNNNIIKSLCRLWLSEGIPFIFREFPYNYEYFREYIAQELNIHPKELTLIGSARIGTSFTSSPCGKEFDLNSDLDWTAVSKDLFNLCKNDFLKWAEEYENNMILPGNDKIKKYWDDNLRIAKKVDAIGYVDANKVPVKPNLYPTTSHILEIMSRSVIKFNDIMPIKIRRSSVRVYRSWKDFINRLSLNLCSTARYQEGIPKSGSLLNQQGQQ